jgi:protocatechuate 3,4-dioxygenase beta subunit
MPSLARLLCSSLILTAAILFHSSSTVYGQLPDAKSKGTGSISGRVTIGDKGAPGILVTAGLNQSASSAQATSDADGHFHIGALTAGQFIVTPVAPLYVLPTSPMTGSGKVVNLSSGEAVEGIDFKLTRGGVITGRVTDSDGRPVIEERLSLDPVDENGASARVQMPRWSNYQMYQTDDRGVYRIYGLPAGHYKVSVGDEPGTISGLRTTGFYQRTYYPDATDPSKASVVDLNEGGEAKNIDISLGRRASTYTVSGRIVDADTGQPLAGVAYAFGVLQKNQNRSYIAGMASPATPTNAQGEFRLEGVEPGNYGVFVMASRFDFGPSASNGPDVYSDPVLFEVIDGDVTNLEIKAERGHSLAGVVVPDGITDKRVLAQLPSLRIGASVNPGSTGIQMMTEGRSSPVGADGSFQIKGLRPGKVSLYLMGSSGNSPRGLSIARIERDGVLQNEVVEIQPGENASGVRIYLAYGTGAIRGQVKFEGGTLPGDVMMFVSLTREGVRGGNSGQVDARGRFLVENLAAGTYEVMLQVVSIVSTNSRRMLPEQRQTVTIADGAESEVLFTVDLSQKDGP